MWLANIDFFSALKTLVCGEHVIKKINLETMSVLKIKKKSNVINTELYLWVFWNYLKEKTDNQILNVIV